MPLEPRIMYDGAAAATAAAAHHHHDGLGGDHSNPTAGQNHQAWLGYQPATSVAAPVQPVFGGNHANFDAATASPAPKNDSPIHEVVFIDAQVPDLQDLLSGVKAGEQVYVLNSNQDGLQQIADILAANDLTHLSSISIVGHGQQGEFTVGSLNLTDSNLAGEAQYLAAIGKSLAPSGDILLYGCDTAGGAGGQQFIADLSAYAGGAHVAASSQDIGTLHTTNGTFENWTLDASTGAIDADTPFTAAALANYDGLLANTTVTASSITTTLTFDADSDGGVSPGDTVTSEVTLTNTGASAASGVAFSETANGLTVVANSVEITPIAVSDSYALVGNTPITESAVHGVLANDIEFNGDTLTATNLVQSDAATHGTVVLNSDGSFTYTPDTGYSGTATFTYTAHDAAGNSDQTATVTLTVSAPDWYVNGATGSDTAGTGTAASPFKTIEKAVTTAAADSSAGVDNTITVAAGTYSGSGITLASGEQLIGAGSGSTTFTVSSGNAVALNTSNSPTYLGNTISGINITDTGSGDGIVADGTVGTLTMSNIVVSTGSGTGILLTDGGTVNITGASNTLDTTSGTALDIANTTIGSSGVTFKSISDGTGTGSSGDGIILDSTGFSGGLTVTGDGSTAGSGGTIENKTGSSATSGAGIYLNDTADVSIAYMQLNGLAYDGIYGTIVTNFSMDHTVVNGANGSAVGEGSVVFGSGEYTGQSVVNGITGVASITNSTISGGYYDNVDVFDWSGSLDLTLNSDTFRDNNATTGDQNVYIDPDGISIINATVTNSTWTGVASGSNFYFDVNSTAAVGSNLTFTGNTVGDDLGGSGGDGGSGIVEAIASSVSNTTSTFDIENNAFTGANGSAVIVANDEAGSPTTTATLNLTFSGNTIGAAAGTHNPSTTDGFGSSGGIGLWVQFNGGTMNATVANNDIYEFATNGIEFQGGLAATGNAAGTLNATVIGNTIEDPSSAAALKGALQVGIYVEPGPNHSAVNSYAFDLTIGGSVASQQNTISVPQSEINSTNGDDIEITQDEDTHTPDAINLTAETGTAGVLSLYGGPGDDSGQQVETFLANNNSTPSNTGGYFALAVTGNGYGDASPSATAPTTGPTFGTPTVLGADTEGATLSASALGASAAFQWQEAFSNGEWVDISGANSSSFTLTEAQIGATLRVVETSVYSDGLVDTVASAATAAAVADNLTVTPPGVSGTAQVGQVLTATTPTTDNSDATITYQWQRDGVNISGATGQTYRATAADVGDTLDVVATATDPHGGNVSETSGATGTVAALAQSLSNVEISAIPVGDAVTVSWEATVNAQSDQLIVNPTYTNGSVTGNFTTVTIPTTTVTLDSLTLSGEIFDDSNADGLLDAGDSAISGVSVSVFASATNTLMGTVTTNGSGVYDLTGLAAGSYYVRINALPSGYSNASSVVDATPDDYLGGRNYGQLSGGFVVTNPIVIAYDSPHPTVAGYPGDDTTGTLDIGLVKGPVIGGTGGAVDFYQGGAAATLDGGITVTDPAGADINSATVTISSGYLSGDTLTFHNGTDTQIFGGDTITATQSGDTLTLSGPATAADYQTALQSVTYSFAGDPTNLGADKTRTVAWSVIDANGQMSAAGSASALDVFMTAVLAGAVTPAPTVTSTSGPVTADSSLTVADNNTLGGAPVATVTISSGSLSGDELFIPSADLSGSTILGTTITVTGNETATLTLTGASGATAAQFQNALDEVQFKAVSPNNGARTLTWSFNDDAGGNTNDSNSFTTNVDAAFGPQITTLVGTPVNGGAVRLDGTGLTSGDTINLYADGSTTTIVGTGIVTAGDTFDITTTADFADGAHTFTAMETNSSNPTIPASLAFSVAVGSVAPTGLAQQGTSTNGGTIEIAGTGDASGDTITLVFKSGATTVATVSGTAGVGGTFDITAPGPFVDGSYSVTAVDTSADGTETSTASTAATAIVGSLAPTGLAQQGTSTNGGTIEIAGMGDASGDTIKLYNGATLVGSGVAGAGGAFDFATTATFADGTYHLTATDTSADGTQTSTASTAATAIVGSVAPTGLAQQGTSTNGGTIEIAG
ncbi:DUF4347 domain-containing protein, partial [Methylocapsa sp. S129]|uniref:DUF4347 domain-containing protein n=1 Tax=Methylocapsa sp. S129 TaxID=1641869 RepID=UPI001AEDAB7B